MKFSGLGEKTEILLNAEIVGIIFMNKRERFMQETAVGLYRFLSKKLGESIEIQEAIESLESFPEVTCDNCKHSLEIEHNVGTRKYLFCDPAKGMTGLHGELKETDYCSRWGEDENNNTYSK